MWRIHLRRVLCAELSETIRSCEVQINTESGDTDRIQRKHREEALQIILRSEKEIPDADKRDVEEPLLQSHQTHEQTCSLQNEIDRHDEREEKHRSGQLVCRAGRAKKSPQVRQKQ